jgi:hypothetical protein
MELPGEATLKVHPHCLLIFIDETGHEEFADKARPIFGYAGCMVMAGPHRPTSWNPGES